MMTADELAAEGAKLFALGAPVVFLRPSQEWMAVNEQIPFIRAQQVGHDDAETKHKT